MIVLFKSFSQITLLIPSIYSIALILISDIMWSFSTNFRLIVSSSSDRFHYFSIFLLYTFLWATDVMFMYHIYICHYYYTVCAKYMRRYNAILRSVLKHWCHFIIYGNVWNISITNIDTLWIKGESSGGNNKVTSCVWWYRC